MGKVLFGWALGMVTPIGFEFFLRFGDMGRGVIVGAFVVACFAILFKTSNGSSESYPSVKSNLTVAGDKPKPKSRQGTLDL